ncbi:MAG: hypothetical protein NVS9B10_15010 [Nevskia sp.]
MALANEKAAPGWHPEAARKVLLDSRKLTPLRRPGEVTADAVLRESQALFVLREAVQALELDDYAAAALFAAASSLAKAMATRMLAENRLAVSGIGLLASAGAEA